MTAVSRFAAATILTASLIAAISPALACVVSVPVAGSDTAEERKSTGYMYMTSSDLELTTDGTTVQIVGIRFPGVAIPKGATITDAYIQFQVDETSSVTTNVTIKAEAADNAPTFTTTAWNISRRARTAASVTWAPPSWTTLSAKGTAQRTPSIKAIVQEIVNRPGWASGNAMAIIIEGTGKRTAEVTPELVVEWTSGGVI
jgi:hypothetical protein